MAVRANLTLLAAICMASLTFAACDARAETACNEDTVRARLTKLEDAFGQPKIRAKLSAAQKDWQEDRDIDDEENAKYLGAVAAYLDMKRNVDAGAIDDACEILTRTDALAQTVLGDL